MSRASEGYLISTQALTRGRLILPRALIKGIQSLTFGATFNEFNPNM
jgi:hypothetical protein